MNPSNTPLILFFFDTLPTYGYFKTFLSFSTMYYIFSSLPRPKLCLGERYCFTRVSLFVCLWFWLWFYLWFCDHDNSKSSWPIFMKFGNKLSYHKIEVKFEFEKNCTSRTQTASKRNLKNAIFQKVSNRYQTKQAGRSVIVK